MKILLQTLCYATLSIVSFMPIQAQSANPPKCIGIGKALQFDGVNFICADSNVVHKIGDNYGGGKVFYVTPKGIHGLVAATRDQGIGINWYDAQDVISNVANHNAAGRAFTDWRLPTKNELNLLYQQRFVVGAFANSNYWSSSECNFDAAWRQTFGDGGPVNCNNESISDNFNVRAVRTF